MYTDAHVHTQWSSDSVTPVEEQIEQAIRLGMKHLCITDHQDYDFPPFRCNFLLNETGEIEPYLRRLQQLKEAYAHRIELLFGIEMGLQPHLAPRINEDYLRYPFDMVIGSTHLFDGYDPQTDSLCKDMSVEAIVRDYFETELANITCTDGFDTMGHLDYIMRVVPPDHKPFVYADYGDVLDEILKALIAKGKALELNTKSLSIGMGTSLSSPAIFARYHQLGGELVTIGSDAHFPQRLGVGFDRAGQILKTAGFTHYCIFRQHKPVMLPL